MAVSSADKTYLSADDIAKIEEYTKQYEAAYAAGDQAGMAAAHDAAETIRRNASTSYSGGESGSDYIKLAQSNYTAPSVGEFSYESAPSYVSQYADQIDALYNQIVNRDPFSYDYTTDPLFSQYKKSYTREGDRAMNDTLAAYATMTGGSPSSAAITAAQQSGDYYMSQLNDKIPELQQLAYGMYMDDLSNQYNQLSALQSMENNNYNQYLNELSQYNADRSLAYQQYSDQLAQQNYANEWNYNQNAALADLMAGAGDYSRYKALGLTDAEIANLQNAYQQSLVNSTGTKKYTSDPYDGKDGYDYESLFQEALASGNPQSFLSQKANYSKYGFTSSTGLYNDFKNWQSNGALEKYDSLKERIKQLADYGDKQSIQAIINRYWDQLNYSQQYDLTQYLNTLGL